MNSPMDADPSAASSSDGVPPAKRVGVAISPLASTVTVPTNLLVQLLQNVDSLEARLANPSIQPPPPPPAAPPLPETITPPALSSLVQHPDLPPEYRVFLLPLSFSFSRFASQLTPEEVAAFQAAYTQGRLVALNPPVACDNTPATPHYRPLHHFINHFRTPEGSVRWSKILSTLNKGSESVGKECETETFTE